MNKKFDRQCLLSKINIRSVSQFRTSIFLLFLIVILNFSNCTEKKEKIEKIQKIKHENIESVTKKSINFEDSGSQLDNEIEKRDNKIKKIKHSNKTCDDNGKCHTEKF